jgi:hypothetical protein
MISINKCRNLVLYILEKNNRGFIEPARFDAFCDLAQRDLFENLFYRYNKWTTNQTKGFTNTEFGDLAHNLKEQIDVFSTYSTPSNFNYNVTTNIWSYTGSDLYRTIGLSLVNAQEKKTDLEEVLKGAELNNMINSSLNAPTTTYPIYTKIGTAFKVYPKVPTGYSLELLYTRTPKAPKWTYVLDVNNNPIYNAGATDRQDIELDESIFALFIAKVLSYCGVSIRESEITQIANTQEAVIEQKQS